MTHHSALLDSYLPFLPLGSWKEMRSTVIGLVRAYGTSRPEPSVRQALAVLTGYIHWVRQQGLVDRPDDPRASAFIDVYLQHRTDHIRPYGAAREAAILRELYGHIPTPRRSTAPLRLPDAPYPAEEVARIRAWATYTRSTRTHLDRAAIAALALGCGLTASEMMVARTEDIIVLSDGIDISVRGARARTVPALQAWAPMLTDVRAGANATGWLIAPGRADRGGQTLNGIRRDLGGDIRPVPRRMRNTWLVTQVNGGTPPSVVMNAAGLLDADFLRGLAPYIHLPNEDDQRALLRKGGAHA